MNTYFLTKRRNLLLSSILLFLVSFSGIEFGQNISFPSIKFSIKEPMVMYIILWMIFIYFFIRFGHCIWGPENKDADNAKGLFSLFVPPTYELYGTSHYDNGKLSVLWRIIVFSTVYLSQFIIFFMRSIFEKDFFEYIFPLLFALFIGIFSWNSAFIESKKPETFELINNFGCKVKQQSYDLILPDSVRKLDFFKTNCNEHSSKTEQHHEILEWSPN